jgi:hypothetical protein
LIPAIEHLGDWSAEQDGDDRCDEEPPTH